MAGGVHRGSLGHPKSQLPLSGKCSGRGGSWTVAFFPVHELTDDRMVPSQALGAVMSYHHSRSSQNHHCHLPAHQAWLQAATTHLHRFQEWRIPGTGGAWRAAVYGVAQSRTRLQWLSNLARIAAAPITFSGGTPEPPLLPRTPKQSTRHHICTPSIKGIIHTH